MCFKYIKIHNKWKSFEKHRKIKEDIYNKRFPVRDIFVNFLGPALGGAGPMLFSGKPAVCCCVYNWEYIIPALIQYGCFAAKSTQNKTEVQTWRTNTWSENKNSGNTKSNNRKWDQVFRNGYHPSCNQLHPPWSKLRRGIRGYGVSCHF
jgi:hypothetical protein